MPKETFSPIEENLGKNCLYWSSSKNACGYPKAEIEGEGLAKVLLMMFAYLF